MPSSRERSDSAGPRMIAVKAALLIACSVLASAAAHAQSKATHEYFFVNGAKLYIEALGEGTPVVFLHGGLMFFDNAYAKQRDHFAAHHRVIGIDQRGHGHSPDGPWQLSYQLMANDTAAVIQKLKVGPVDVVGHSDGANIALLLARDHPELVRRMVISGANLRGWSPQLLQARKQLPPAQLEETIAKLAASLPPFFRVDYGAVSPDGPDHWTAMVTKCFWLWGQSIVIEPGELKKIQAPVMVVAGDHDFTSIEETTEIFRGLPHGQLFVVPGTGHGTFLSRPELLNLAISEFLDQPDTHGAYLRHNVGVNSTRMVNTSRRPSSIAAEQTQVWKSVSTP
jgi:pimeloyl-ACP methyl ester carboxylesterase